MLNKKSNSSVGLDIGTSSIKLVGLNREDNSTKVLGYSTTPTPKRCFVAGGLSDPGALASSINKALQISSCPKIELKKIVIALPSEVTKSKIIKVPKNSSRKYVSNLINNTFDSRDSIFDIYSHKISRPNQPNGHDIFSVRGVAKNTRKNLNFELSKIGLHIDSFKNQADGLARLLGGKSSKKPFLVLDIGENYSRLYYTCEYSLFLARYPIGCNEIISGVAQSFDISQKEAAQLTAKIGLDIENLGQEILKATAARLNNLSSNTSGTIADHYFSAIQNQKPSQIILTGWAASIPGLRQYLAKNIGLPTQIIEPWKNISIYPLNSMPKKLYPSYSSAAGLALSGYSI